MEQDKEYYAFISYKREDKKEAKRLQHALEYYRLSNHLGQENPRLPEYVRIVFCDMTGFNRISGELLELINVDMFKKPYWMLYGLVNQTTANKYFTKNNNYAKSLVPQFYCILMAICI